MTKCIVRKGYAVITPSRIYEEGSEIPSSIQPMIIKDQGWKIELIDFDTKQMADEVRNKAIKSKEVTKKD